MLIRHSFALKGWSLLLLLEIINKNGKMSDFACFGESPCGLFN